MRGKPIGKKAEILQIPEEEEPGPSRPPSSFRPRSRSAGSRRSRNEMLAALRLENGFLRAQLEAKKNALLAASESVSEGKLGSNGFHHYSSYSMCSNSHCGVSKCRLDRFTVQTKKTTTEI